MGVSCGPRGGVGWTVKTRLFDAAVGPGGAGGAVAGSTCSTAGQRLVVDSEERVAVQASDACSIEATAEVANGDRLRFGYSANGSKMPVTFSVAVRQSGEAREVWRDRVPAGGGGGARWKDVEVDLGALTGAAVISFRVELDDPAGDSSPLWSEPLLVGPTSVAAPSVLLISVDTLGAERMSLYGYNRSTTPNLEAWAGQRAVIFENAVAAAPWTLPSHATILTGLDPLQHGVNFDVPGAGVPSDVDTLAELLQRAGYTTAAITGGGFLHPRFGFGDGFDRYRFWPSEGDPDTELQVGVQRALNYVQNHREVPSFLFLHTYEVHSPNGPREPYFSRISPDWDRNLRVRFDQGQPSKANAFVGMPAATLVDGEKAMPLPVDQVQLPGDLYDSAVAYADGVLAELLNAPELANWVVALTSDHGESLGRGGRWSHVHLSDDNLLVPLVVRWPTGPRSSIRVTEQVSLVDLAPTILSLVGAEVPARMDGESLLDTKRRPKSRARRYAWSYSGASNRGLSVRIGNRWKVTWQDAVWDHGRTVLYDLASDPDEVAGSEPDETWIASAVAEMVRRSDEAPAVRVTLENFEDGEVFGVLESSLIDAVTTKASRLGGARIEWAGRGRVRFRLEPGSTVSLALAPKAGPHSWGGWVKIPTCPAEVAFLPADQVAPGTGVRVGTATCEARLPHESVGASDGFGVLWSDGPGISRVGSPDPDLDAQLRALGYLGR